jgi:hypothetical protein
VRVEEDDGAHPLGEPFHRAADGHPAVAVRDEHRVVEVLVLEDPHDVVDVRLQADVRRQQVRAFTEPGQGRRVDVVALSAQA